MKRFLEKRGLWLLLAIAVVAVTLAAMSILSSTASPLGNLVGVITSPFRSAAQSVADWYNEKQDYFADNRALRAANDVQFTMWVGIGSMVGFRIVGSWILCVQLGWGAVGVWIAMVLDWVCRVSFFLSRTLSGKWLRKV